VSLDNTNIGDGGLPALSGLKKTGTELTKLGSDCRHACAAVAVLILVIAIDQARRFAMKTDAELKSDVLAEMGWNPAIDTSHISVAVKDGVVALMGHVDSYAGKCAVERAVKRVSGVREIAMEIDVKLAPGHLRNDAEITAAIESAFRWHALIPEELLRVKVESGFVTLEGEVEWDFQRSHAEKAVRPLTGVRGLVNNITLKPRPRPDNIVDGIREALVRHADAEARHIDVRLDGNTVTLQGKVDSWAERELVQGAAWSAPGISKVINEIRVGT
jgi:osmotically-inducible protein OsmY